MGKTTQANQAATKSRTFIKQCHEWGIPCNNATYRSSLFLNMAHLRLKQSNFSISPCECLWARRRGDLDILKCCKTRNKLIEVALHINKGL
jgi:hypothetical protein